jgi:predicted ATPase
MAKIKIKNFGPIRQGFLDNDGWLDMKKVTVFIGNQGSGKSTAAKLFSTLTWIEKAMVRGQIKPDELKAYNRFLKQLKYQRIDNYIKDTTEIGYQSKSYHFHFADGIFTAEKANENGYMLPKIMYVSAERNFLSVVDRPDKLKNLPSPLFTFLDEYDSARNLYSKGVTLPIGDAQFEYDALNKIAHISGDDYKLRLSEASSGFQSTVPLYLVTKFLTESLHRENDPSVKTQSIEEQRKLAREIERIMSDPALSEEVRQESLRQLSAKYKPSCFINIVEEPEQNLFPGSQQKLLYSLLEYNNSNEGNKLVMTTHSPYLINYLSIAIQGGALLQLIKASNGMSRLIEKLETVIPRKSVINAEDVAVYQMDEAEGTISKLPNPEGIPSDNNYLNQSIRQGNIMFDRLLEIEEEL